MDSKLNFLFGQSPSAKPPASNNPPIPGGAQTSAPSQFSMFFGAQTQPGFSLAPSNSAPKTTSAVVSNTPNFLANTTLTTTAANVSSASPRISTTLPSMGVSNVTTSTTCTPTFGVSTPTTATTTTSLFTSTLALPTSTTTTTTVGIKPATTQAQAGTTVPQTQAMNFQELQEIILNKWTSELIEQEKVFLNQANQINTWDKIINENTEKLKQLHCTMEKVRKQQTKINDDLEVISTHQKDLENCLIPMEKENFPLSAHKTDPNRKNLYMNATSIDSQIKRMSEDLKETIEQINETSRLHDNEDPVIQIGRILNAHMESLKWIDEHTSKMQDYLDSLLKAHDSLRRECDILNKIEGY